MEHFLEIKMLLEVKGLLKHPKITPSASTSPIVSRLPEIESAAQDGSPIAQRVLKALCHFCKGLSLMLDSERQSRACYTFTSQKRREMDIKVMEDMAICFRMDPSVAFWTNDHILLLREVITRAFSSLECLYEEPKNYLDRDARICQAYLVGFRVNSRDALNCLEKSIRKYPEEPYFRSQHCTILAILGDFSAVVHSANKHLEMFPKNPELLYARAASMTFVKEYSPSQKITAWKNYLLSAEKDEPKYPDALYGLGIEKLKLQEREIEVNIVTAKRCFDQGRNAETRLLPCFLPCQSRLKSSVEVAMQMFYSLHGIYNSPASLETSAVGENLIMGDMRKGIEYRKEHRFHQALLYHLTDLEILPKPLRQTNSLEIPEPLFKINDMDLATMKRNSERIKNSTLVFIHDVQSNYEYGHEKTHLAVTVIEDLSLGLPSVRLVVEDRYGNVQRLFIYNFPEHSDLDSCQKVLGFGCHLTILNPVGFIAHDGKPALRVDDFENQVLCEPLELRSDACRYCGSSGTSIPCQKYCGRLYCCEECCKADDDLLKHQLICDCDVQFVKKDFKVYWPAAIFGVATIVLSGVCYGLYYLPSYIARNF